MTTDQLDMAPKRKKRRTKAQAELYSRLCAIRDHKGLSNQELAEFIGVSLDTLQAWLYGKNYPSRFTMPLIDKAEQS